MGERTLFGETCGDVGCGLRMATLSTLRWIAQGGVEGGDMVLSMCIVMCTIMGCKDNAQMQTYSCPCYWCQVV